MPALSLLMLAVCPVQESIPSETVVTAPRSTRTASAPIATTLVITAEQLEETGERSLPRAIARASGISVQETNLGGGSPYMRGLIGNQILIVVDGVRLNDSTTRGGPNQSLNSIDAATVQRVEILRGPSSVLYGSDALGGAILVWTKTRPPAARFPEGDPQASALRTVIDGQYLSAANGWEGSLELSGAGAKDGLLGIGSYHAWSDLTAGDGEEVPNTAYDGLGWFGSWEHLLDPEHGWRLTASRTRDFNVPRTDRMNTGFGQTQPSDAENFYALEDRQRYVLTYDDEESGPIADSMQARLSFRRYLEQRQQLPTGSSTRRLESDQTDTLGAGVDWRKAIGDSHLLTWGLDADYDQIDSVRNDLDLNSGTITPNDGAFAPDSRYLSTGVFVQDEILALRPFDVTAGLRYSYFDFAFDDFTTGDDVDGEFGALTGSLQAARDIGTGSRLTATLSQGFRAPNLADLAKNATFFGGTELANPDLEPEQSWMAELAWDFARPTWSTGLAVYYNQIDDAIGALLIDDNGTPQGGDDTWQRENVGEVRYAGFEAQGVTRIGGASSPVSLRAVVDAVWGRQFDPTVDPATNTQPLYDVPARRVPPLHGSVGLRYEPQPFLWRIAWAELAYNWALEQDELNPGDLADPRIDPDGTAAWDTVDLDLGGPLGDPAGGSSWHFGLHNIFDESYRVHGSGFDSPGFGVVIGLRLSL